MTLRLTAPPSRAHIGALAGAFTDVLYLWLSPEEIARVRIDNVEHVFDQLCASHDYCDPNMAMLEAFQTTFGVDPRLEVIDGQDGADVPLWGAAWELAKTVWLTASESEASAAAADQDDDEILVLFSDQDGASLMTLTEFCDHLVGGARQAPEVARIRNALVTNRSYEGGGGAEPVWKVELTTPDEARSRARELASDQADHGAET